MADLWRDKRFKRVIEVLRALSDLPGLIAVFVAVAAGLAFVGVALWNLIGRMPVAVLIPLMLALFFAVFALVLVGIRRFTGREPDGADPDLRVTILRKDWDLFQHQARFLEMQVEIENRTDRRKKLTGFMLTFPRDGYGVSDMGPEFDLTVRRELERRRQAHPRLDHISIIEPRDTVKGWMAYVFSRSPRPGEPQFTFTVVARLSPFWLGCRMRVAPDRARMRATAMG